MYTLPSSLSIDWTDCGIPGGIPIRTTVYTTLNPGATVAQINTAIANCPSGQVVKLNAGTYNLTAMPTFKSKNSVTWRGSGPGSTIVNIVGGYGSSNEISDYYGFTGAMTISSGYTKGSTSLTMSATPTNFTVGRLISIYQNDDITLVMSTDGPGQNLSTIHKITNKAGNVLTIDPPLPYTLTAGLTPRAAYCAGTSATLCGIEDMTINAVEDLNCIMTWANADRCWVKGCELYNGDNIFIWVYGSFQCEFRRNYTHHAWNAPNNTDGYGVYLYEGSSFCLLEDNIYYEMAVSMMQSQSSCNAFLYNYAWKSTFNSAPWQFCMINANHGAHNLMSLWEGNMAEQWQSDGYHGTASHQTLFRNWFHGLHPTNTTNRKMIDLCRGTYYCNSVGNVLGDSTWNPTFFIKSSGAHGYDDSIIYRTGYPNMTNGDVTPAVPWPPAYGLTYPDATVLSTLLRHANYDYYNKAVVWNGDDDHTIPNSLFYSSKPSYFGNLDWPAIGPDVSGYIKDTPSKNRWSDYLVSGNINDLFADQPAGAASYSLTIVPTTQTVSKGAVASYDVTVTAESGFTGDVTLGLTGLPVGVTPTFETNPLGADETTELTIPTTALNLGTLTLTVNGEG